MSEFNIEPQPLDIPQPNQNGEVLKNVKELKVANGNFYIDPSGKLELRDSNGNVVILMDPNG